MKKRILFVDDDGRVLEALQGLAAPMAREWDMVFAEGGAQALEKLDGQPFDAVLTDLGMPGIGGRAVLEHTRMRYPAAIRIAFSGPSDLPLLTECLGVVHQVLPPCFGLEELIALLANAARLGAPVVDEGLRRAIGSLDRLPTVPRLYKELQDALESEDATVKTVGDIINQDMGMTAKLLSLVNSAFFGLRRQVETLQEAVAFLGTDTIKVLVLAHGLFDQTGALGTERVSLDDIWRHSLAVAKGARALAAMEGLPRLLKAEAFMGGMLHDVGILVLAKNFPARYDRVVKHCAERKVSMVLGERQEFGLGHPEVGAFLLGLWGIQPAVIKAVSLHHTPSALRATAFNPLLAIHLADDLCGGRGHHPLFEWAEVDEKALSSLGIRDHMAGWRKVLAEPHW